MMLFAIYWFTPQIPIIAGVYKPKAPDSKQVCHVDGSYPSTSAIGYIL